MEAFFIFNDIYKETLFNMKDINEQIERIKQLFTEERLHGNLVESNEVTKEGSEENMDEQLGKRIKQGVKDFRANRAEKRAERKQKRADKAQVKADKAQTKASELSAKAAATKEEPSSAEAKPVEKSTTSTAKSSKGDFTKPLQRLGGAQKGYTYHLVGPKKAEKRDSNGKVVATYIRESKLNKKALFESVYTFDPDNVLYEQWTWQEGNGGSGKALSSGLSKKFDDAIAQIGDGSSAGASAGASSTAKSEKPSDTETGGESDVDGAGESDVDGAGEENSELEEEWKNFPCVYNNPNKKAQKREDGTTSFTINNVRFFNNGRCEDTKTKEIRNYKCNGEKIVIGKGKEDKLSTGKSDKPVEGKVINNIEVLTGDDSWWGNLTHSNFTAGLVGGAAGLAIAAALPDNIFVDRRKGVKGLVDALDGWVDNEDLAYVAATLNYFKDKKYKDPVSGQLVPAITKIKELYKEDEGEDLIADIQSVGTKTLSNIELKNGSKVSPDEFKKMVVNSIR